MLWVLTETLLIPAVMERCSGVVLSRKRESVGRGGWDGVVNEGEESSSTRISRAVITENDVVGKGVTDNGVVRKGITNNGVVGKGIGGEDEGGLEFGFLYAGNKEIFCAKEGRV